MLVEALIGTLAPGFTGPSTALSAHQHSFAVGLLEALSQCVAEQRRVLLVAYDTAACGALASVNPSRGLLGVALLLAPLASVDPRDLRDAPETRARWRLQVRVQTVTGTEPVPGAGASLTLRSAAAQPLQDNAMASALPVFERLARGELATCSLPLSPGTRLYLDFSHLPLKVC